LARKDVTSTKKDGFENFFNGSLNKKKVENENVQKDSMLNKKDNNKINDNEKKGIEENIDTIKTKDKLKKKKDVNKQEEVKETPEAKLLKALDNMEALISHNEADISTWLPNEYELNQTYAWDRVGFSEYMIELRREILKDTLEKIEKEG
jgi:hypothetical protein